MAKTMQTKGNSKLPLQIKITHNKEKTKGYKRLQKATKLS